MTATERRESAALYLAALQVGPFNPEAAQVFSQAICIIRLRLGLARYAEQSASGIRQAVRLPTYVNYRFQLQSIKQVEAIGVSREVIRHAVRLRQSPRITQSINFFLHLRLINSSAIRQRGHPGNRR